jgi:hypothetical protein
VRQNIALNDKKFMTQIKGKFNYVNIADETEFKKSDFRIYCNWISDSLLRRDSFMVEESSRGKNFYIKYFGIEETLSGLNTERSAFVSL